MSAWPTPTIFTTAGGLEITLRPAQEEDAAGLVVHLEEVSGEGLYVGIEKAPLNEEDERHFIQRRSQQAEILICVAEAEGTVIGMGTLFPGRFGDKDRHVGTLGMSLGPRYRELGIEGPLVGYLLAWSQAAGYEKIQLEVFSTNAPAVELYGRLGFQVEGVQRRAYKLQGEYVDGILMGKFLDRLR